MSILGFITFLVIGFVAGLIARAIVPTSDPSEFGVWGVPEVDRLIG